MSSTKRFWLPYASYDMENIKNWLEEKAEDGYILKKMKSNFPVFLEAERGSSIKYHLEPTVKDRSKPPEEIIETRKQRGWQYAGTLPDFFHVYYAEKGTSEFNHQPEDIAHKLKEKLRSDKKSLLLQIPLSLLIVLSDMINPFRSEEPLLWFYINFTWFHIVILLIFILSNSFKILAYLKLKEFVKPSEERKENGETSSVIKVLGFAGDALIMLFLLIFLYQALWGDLSKDGAYTVEQQQGYPMQVLQLTEDYYHAQHSEENDGRSPYVWTRSSLLLNKQLYSSYLSYEYYRYNEFSVEYYRGVTEDIRESFQRELVEGIQKTEKGSLSSEDIDGMRVLFLKTHELVYSFYAFEEHLIFMRTPMDFWSVEYSASYFEAFQEDLKTLEKGE